MEAKAKIDILTEEQQMLIWEAMFDAANDKAQELGVPFSPFELADIMAEGLLDLIAYDAREIISDEWRQKLSESGIPQKACKFSAELLNFFIEEGKNMTGSPIMVYHLFFLSSLTNYTMVKNVREIYQATGNQSKNNEED